MLSKLIVIEGLDGSGKATQAALLAKHLVSLQQMDGRGGQKPVKKVSFPDYESQSSALVKMYLAGEFGAKPGDVNAYAASSFYAVDRYASFKKDWWRDWETGIVIADRYTTSNAIHQCSKLDRSEWEGFLDWLFDFEYKKLGIPEPDVVVYLRVETSISQTLLKKRYHGDMSREDIHEKDVNYLLRCQDAADYCAKHLNWNVVECTENGSMRSIEEIQANILELIEAS